MWQGIPDRKTSLKPSEDVYKKADDVQLNKSVKKIGFLFISYYVLLSKK